MNLEDAVTVSDEQLRYGLREALGEAQFISFRQDRAALDRFCAQLPPHHWAIRPEQYARCATAEGLIYENAKGEGLLYRKGHPRPAIPLDPEKAAIINSNLRKLRASSSGAPANEKPTVPESPAVIARTAAALLENARKAGMAMSTTEAVRSVMQSNCEKTFDPNDAGSIALATRSIVEAGHRKGKTISYTTAVNELIGKHQKLDPNSPAAIALKAHELVTTTRNSGKFISYANAVAQVMNSK
jgi:hypothetical protein